MTCYQRHLGWLLDALDLPADKTGKQRLHHEIVGVLGMKEDAACPAIWAALKDTYAVDAKTPSAQLVADVSLRMNRR